MRKIKTIVAISIATLFMYGCEIIEEEDEINTPIEYSGDFTDNRDNNTYKWVRIGNQVWMAENLAFKANGGGCWAYDANTSNVTTHGYLYDWTAAMSAVPEGWHLPTDAEWLELVDYLSNNGYTDSEGFALKSTFGWFQDGNGDNAFGFNALPSGLRNAYGVYMYKGETTMWYSSSEEGNYGAWVWRIGYLSSYISSNDYSYARGCSVRCIKNN